MFSARLKRLEANVSHLLDNGANRPGVLSCLEEATSLSKALEQERDELGQEILKLRKSRSVARSYFQSIEMFKGKRN